MILFSVDHDVKVEEAQYDVTGRNLVTGKEDNGADGGGPIPGSVNNPSPKEVKHTKGPTGENYAQLDKGPPKQDYAKPDVTKKRKVRKCLFNAGACLIFLFLKKGSERSLC